MSLPIRSEAFFDAVELVLSGSLPNERSFELTFAQVHERSVRKRSAAGLGFALAIALGITLWAIALTAGFLLLG